MAKKTVKIKIDAEKCKGCMLCINVCPRNVLEISEKINRRGMQYVAVCSPDRCTGCGLCALVCPDCAIEYE